MRKSDPTAKAGKKLEPRTPPAWHLGDLYSGPADPALEADLTAAARKARSLRRRLEGRLAELDGAALGRAVREFERLDETLARVMSYAQLLFAADQAAPGVAGFYQTMSERTTDISSEVLFFELELNRMGERRLARQIALLGLANVHCGDGCVTRQGHAQRLDG